MVVWSVGETSTYIVTYVIDAPEKKNVFASSDKMLSDAKIWETCRYSVVAVHYTNLLAEIECKLDAARRVMVYGLSRFEKADPARLTF